jgi:hypothetical protein
MRAPHRAALAALLLLATTTAVQAAPVLEITSRCTTDAAAPGSTATVVISLTPDSAAISGLDFALRYNPASLVFQGAALPDSLAARGGWDQPVTPPMITPGTLPVLVAPKLQVPLPAFPAGPVAVVTFALAPTAAEGCQTITFVPESVVFSAPPLGLAVPGGPPMDGGLLVSGTPVTTTTRPVTPTTLPVEVCSNCKNDDGDSDVDLADADCHATPLTIDKVVARRGRPRTPADDRITMRATLPHAIADLGGSVHVAIGGGTPLACEPIPAAAFRANRRQTKFVYKHAGPGITLVRLMRRGGRMAANVTLRGRPLGDNERALAFSLALGDAAYHGSAPLRAKGKKLVFP